LEESLPGKRRYFALAVPLSWCSPSALLFLLSQGFVMMLASLFSDRIFVHPLAQAELMPELILGSTEYIGQYQKIFTTMSNAKSRTKTTKPKFNLASLLLEF
jgi:hypothetical protein